jgi:hypothetical protein
MNFHFPVGITLAQLRTLELDGSAIGLEEQLAQPRTAALSVKKACVASG